MVKAELVTIERNRFQRSSKATEILDPVLLIQGVHNHSPADIVTNNTCISHIALIEAKVILDTNKTQFNMHIHLCAHQTYLQGHHKSLNSLWNSKPHRASVVGKHHHWIVGSAHKWWNSRPYLIFPPCLEPLRGNACLFECRCVVDWCARSHPPEGDCHCLQTPLPCHLPRMDGTKTAKWQTPPCFEWEKNGK